MKFKDFPIDLEPVYIRTYGYNDYFFDVVIDFVKGEYGYWLYHPSCGIKSFMHGCSMDDCDYKDFILLILSDIDDDISFYNDEYNF